MRSLSIVLLLAAFSFSGCLDSPGGASYHAFATEGSYTTGFAYDGRGIVPFDGPVYIDVDEEGNTGRVIAKGRLGQTPFEIEFTEFAESRPFHDGGITTNLVEHGDSGVGDKSIPRVDLEMAGWGRAHVTYAGNTYKDPRTQNDTWVAHFMVIRNGVRDNASGAIFAAENKTENYDPAKPSQGFSSPGDHEVHIVLRNGTGSFSSGSSGRTSSTAFTAPSPNFDQTIEMFTATELGYVANISLRVSDSLTRGTNLTFTLRAPSGDTVMQETLGDANVVPGTSERVVMRSFDIQELGAYELTIAGRGNAGGEYEVTATLEPPPAVVINLWWEEVLFGVQAIERARVEGFLGGPQDQGATTSTTT